MTKPKRLPKPRGPTSWVHGSKLLFFERHKEEWEQARRMEKLKKWGRLMYIRYLVCYGPLDIRDDLEVTPDVPSVQTITEWEANEAAILSSLPTEEVETRQAAQLKFVMKILQWYQNHYTTMKKSDGNPIKVALETAMSLKKPMAPRRLQAVQVYTRVYWETLKPLADAEHNVAMAAFEKSQDEHATAEAPPEPMTAMRAVTMRCWDAEKPAVQEEIRGLVEREYTDAMAVYEIDKDKDFLDMTGKDYHKALDTAVTHLEDAIQFLAKNFGLVSSVLMAGPLGPEGGILVRGIHAGNTWATDVPWPKADPTGYTRVEAAMIRFGEMCFPSDEREARGLNGGALSTPTPVPDAGDTSTPTSAATLTSAATPSSADALTFDTSLSSATSSTSAAAPVASTLSAAPAPSVSPMSLSPVPPSPPPTPRFKHGQLGKELLEGLALLVPEERRECLLLLKSMNPHALEMQSQRSASRLRLYHAGMAIDRFDDTTVLYGRRVQADALKELEEKEAREKDERAERRRMHDTEVEQGTGKKQGPSEEKEKEAQEQVGEENVRMERQHDDNMTEKQVDDDQQRDSPPDIPPPGTTEKQVDDDQQTDSPPDIPPPGDSPILNGKRPRPEGAIDDDVDDDVAGLTWDTVDMAGWWPELRSAFRAFQRGRSWPSCWLQLVDSFLVFEQRSGFLDDKANTLSTANRPQAVSQFMKTRRQWEKPQDIGELHAFVREWWNWWKGLQPETRIVDNALRRPDMVEWGLLSTKCGRNGLALVLGCLLWWGDVVHETVEYTADDHAAAAAAAASKVDWTLAVGDVTWAIENMVKNVHFNKLIPLRTVSRKRPRNK